jgi:hypothetical protein
MSQQGLNCWWVVRKIASGTFINQINEQKRKTLEIRSKRNKGSFTEKSSGHNHYSRHLVTELIGIHDFKCVAVRTESDPVIRFHTAAIYNAIGEHK